MSRRILIVEDEAVTSVMLEKTLKELGYEVVGSAFDGEEAIALAAEKRPDLVLMDIRIQGDMDGIETAKRIYQQYDIPIIYLTAHSDDDTIQRAVASGPFGYLIKPFKERELYSNIEMVAHKHKLYRNTGQRPQTLESRPAPEPPRQKPTQQESPLVQTPVPAPPIAGSQTALKTGDYRLAVLSVQFLPHPVILFNPSGGVMYANNACRTFFKTDQMKNDAIRSIDDLPELFRKIWESGHDRFRNGKGFAINGQVPVRGTIRKVRIDMIPLFERGTLQFISSVIFPDAGGAGEALSGMNTLLDEAENRVKEIRFLASTEETFRLRKISLYSTEVIRKLRELRGISTIGEEKKKGPG
ncbi:MAG TPA: response regulator [Methanospirillum sp.]|nr:response regulator [Methanospirillum sp.]